MHFCSRLLVLAAPMLLVIPAAAAEPVFNNTVAFNTQDQSIWSSGNAFQFDFSQYFGVNIDPSPVTFNPSAISGTGYSVDPYFLFDSNFNTGMQVGAQVSGGSLNATLNYNITLDVPDAITSGQPFSLMGSATRLNSSSFQSSPADASAWLDAILTVYLGGYARFVTSGIGLGSHDYRMGDTGFTDGSTANTPYRTLINANYSPEIIGINRNGNGQLTVLGINEGGVGSQYTTGATTVTAGDWHVAAAGLQNAGILQGSDEKTLLTATVDIDQMATGGVPVLGTGVSHDWGAISMDAGYNIVDVTASLAMGMRQDFAIHSSVMAHLQFSQPVNVEGIGTTDSIVVPIDAIPAITLLTDSVTVNPEFIIDSSLQNDTALTFVAGMGFVFFEGHIHAAWDAGIFGSGTAANFDYGPIYESHPTYPLFDINVFSDEFALGGFNIVPGQSFVLGGPIAATWTGASGNWSDAAQWSSSHAPGNNSPLGSHYNVALESGTVVLDINTTVSALSISHTSGTYSATLDLSNNALVLQASDATDKAAKIAELQNQIAQARNGGSWTGTGGITSSTVAADATHSLSLALIDNDTATGLGLTNYRGQDVNDNSLIIVAAHIGDTTIDGKIDIQDLNKVTAHWQKSTGSLWSDGDTTGPLGIPDGKVDIQDLNAVTANWQFGTATGLSPDSAPVPSALSTASVPEPSTLALAALGSLALLKKSKRRT